MINQTILFLPQTDCTNPILKPYAKELGINVNWNPDIHLGKPLSKIFNQVLRHEIGESYTKHGVIKANKMIVDLVKEHNPKYVIWPTMSYEIFEETFQEIRELETYVIGWFFDDETRFDEYSRWWTPYMDYIFTADKASVSKYRQLGAKAYHLLVTGEPDDFKFISSGNTYDVSFVGSRHIADRDNLVKQLSDDEVSISTFGNGWANGFVSHDEMTQVFNSSKINICFTKAYVGKQNQLKGKIFDITMCGGFLLCEYVEGIEDYFELGKEIICFNNYKEALDKIHYFLKNDSERTQIAKAGQLRATSELAQHKLLENNFTAIEKDIQASPIRIFPSTSVLNMPKYALRAHAHYHVKWAKVLKEVGFGKNAWKDEYNVAYKYDSVYSIINFKLKYLGFIINVFKKAFKKINNHTFPSKKRI
jgi:spore maturation protein CgeB